jgi:hypothetical protein
MFDRHYQRCGKLCGASADASAIPQTVPKANDPCKAGGEQPRCGRRAARGICIRGHAVSQMNVGMMFNECWDDV